MVNSPYFRSSSRYLLALVCLISTTGLACQTQGGGGPLTIPGLEQLQPKAQVLTQRVKKPIPGNPQSLNLSNAEQLDQFAQNLTYSGTSVSELAALLSPQARTDAEKARLAYSWITQHIGYDVTLNRDDLSPEGVLQRRKTICGGYANLYQALAKEMGLQAVIIEGYAKGVGGIVGDDSQLNHAWNAVDIEGAWYLIDTTWGAGNVNNQEFQAQFSPFYFATPPTRLINTHFPAETQWQLFQPLMTRTEFDQLPVLSPRFYRDRLTLAQPNQGKLQANGNLALSLGVPDDIQVVARLQTDQGQELATNQTLVQRIGNQATVQVAFPNPGNYQLLILSKNSQETIYAQAIAVEIQALAAGQPFPKTYGTFSDKQVYLQMPLATSLPANQAAQFQLRVPQAQKVLVIDSQSKKWVELGRSGDVFSGPVFIGNNPVVVVAQFPGSEKFWSLLEYN
ncbi:transglutaminase domain-containing protein [Synechocystis sp. LKSZ1]|uniref:transglutaminase domain-containing protein n=1 Tax=Synechocystis sp. LKSZ1 TaxID=3144951 RepID=UPI00336BE948